MLLSARVGNNPAHLHADGGRRLPPVLAYLPPPRGPGASRYSLTSPRSPCAVLIAGAPQFISIKDKGNIGKILRNWPRINEARISVVTDGELTVFGPCPAEVRPEPDVSQARVSLVLETLGLTACPSPSGSSLSTSPAPGTCPLPSPLIQTLTSDPS